MDNHLFQYEPAIRLGVFASTLSVMAIWEILAPRRQMMTNKPLHWVNNLGLVFVNSFLLRILAPVGAVGVAAFAQSSQWGLFHAVSAPDWLAVLVSVVLLDMTIYLQHVMFHAVPILWRLHLVHHADLDFDVTTGLRFHTVEILLSFGIKAGAILLLGAPALAVLIFEVLLNASSMFNHSNVRMPLGLDRAVRLFVVTPDMHRVHHSVIARETNSNFGFNLPWWDRLFGTYRDQPAEGHTDMTIGLSQFRDDRRVERLQWMLALPFTGQVGDYPINRRGSEQGHTTTDPRDADIDR